MLYFGTMLAIGFACRKRARNVDGFVLGGRTVGPWLTAFAYGTSYFLQYIIRRYKKHADIYYIGDIAVITQIYSKNLLILRLQKIRSLCFSVSDKIA